jgi:predicted lipoprotein
MTRVVLLPCGIVLLAALFWFWPLFHIVRVDELEPVHGEGMFDAVTFAQDFWKERILPAQDDAVDARTFLTTLQEESQKARENFGRKVGLSRTRYYLLKGIGTVLSVDSRGVSLVLDENDDGPDVVLHTGMLFGNTVRDASGLLDAGDFTHSRDFNHISTELNRIVEQRVIPALKEQAKPGGQIRFYGCAELADHARITRPLKIIPLLTSAE